MTAGGTAFDVERRRGSAAELHALDEAERPTLTWFEVTRPALVLGSTQHESVVDAEACAEAGVDVVRRRSGGGAVLLVPGEVAWFDVSIPRGHPRWHDDIGLAPLWVGEAVVAALATDDVVVHRGPMVHSTWSRLVCFAGTGPGEVMRGSAKVAGLSQRRRRGTARFQVAVYRRWDPSAMVRLLAPPAPKAAELGSVVSVADLQLDALAAALVAHPT